MVEVFRRKGDTAERLESERLDGEKLAALQDEVRMGIMQSLAREPSYPSRIAQQLDTGKQRAYYHFRKLEEAGLIERHHQEKVSGGQATFYRPSSQAYTLDLGTAGEKVFLPEFDGKSREFLEPLVEGDEIQGVVVVGSPDQHGPDQVRARDGHLAGEICAKLGNYARPGDNITVLDTDIFRDEAFDRDMLLLGGVLTNTVTKKFNREFPAYFSGEEFPYREIETPEDTYREEAVGLVARTETHQGNTVFLVAGIRGVGTRAAVLAFRDLESIVSDYKGGDFYRLVRGRDMDGDGRIDDYEVVE